MYWMDKCQNCFGGMGGVEWELTCTVTDINRRARDTEKPLFNSSITPPSPRLTFDAQTSKQATFNKSIF